jgi:hypothetical protein
MEANAPKKISVSKFNNGEITIKGLSNLQYDVIMDLVMSWEQREYKHLIDTLEVKEVDLEREIDKMWDNTSDAFSEDGWKEFEEIAKYFFELGLKAQKGE